VSIDRRLGRAEALIAARQNPGTTAEDVLERVGLLHFRHATDLPPVLAGRTKEFLAVSAAADRRGEHLPPAGYLAGDPHRVPAWHFSRGARRHGGQLGAFLLRLLRALGVAGGDEDRDRIRERPAMPAEVLDVFVEDAEAVPLHECQGCGLELPVRPGRQGGAEPVRYFDNCPLCGPTVQAGPQAAPCCRGENAARQQG
jgi:hypothetical protein